MRSVCADCGHHKSVHQYRPGLDHREGPKDCRLCDCEVYRQPELYERITKKHPIKLTMVRMDDLVEYGACPTCGASADQQCHYIDEDGAAVEVGSYVHTARAEDPDSKPCLRELDGEEWWCVNDHTGCLWNDGNNTCMHEGNSLSPLENTDDEKERSHGGS